MKKVEVIFRWQDGHRYSFAGKTTVVIDVLRASNTMITALNNGAKEIIPVAEVETARELKAANPHYLLGGERHCCPIEGFNFGNGPREYKPELVTDQTVVLTTSNGSQAIHTAIESDPIIIASMANLDAVAAFLQDKEDIMILCSGSFGQLSIEDTCCAGAIVNQLNDVNHDDSTLIALNAYLGAKEHLADTFLLGINGQKLNDLNLSQDVQYCAETNTTTTIPILKDGTLTKYIAE